METSYVKLIEPNEHTVKGEGLEVGVFKSNEVRNWEKEEENEQDKRIIPELMGFYS